MSLVRRLRDAASGLSDDADKPVDREPHLSLCHRHLAAAELFRERDDGPVSARFQASFGSVPIID
ncbi:MAG: hypothetical protein AB7Q81_25555 [Gammaproteobacteria bacterium]|uniref:hypothetical protein n=1 Tax=Bradyrhizobium sp. TaxID=376 RepID=UPI003D0F1433